MRFSHVVSILAGIVAALAVALLPLQIVGLVAGVLIVGSLILIEPAALLVLLLVFAPLRALLNTESAVFASNDPGQLLLAGLLAVVAGANIVRFRRVRLTGIPVTILPLLVYFLAITLSVTSTVSVNGWLREWVKWLQILLLALLTIYLSWRVPLIYIVAALVTAGAANAAIGLYQFFGGSGALHLLVNGRFFRAFGTFGQPNPFGASMGILIPVAASVSVACLFKVWRIWQQQKSIGFQFMGLALFFGSSAALMAAGLIASWSRGAWLGFFASITIITLSFPPRLWQSMALLVFGGVSATVAWFAGL
ncbi:MAG: hypothetical protein AAFR22_16205, partial [Chloroflexota bacterium]